MTNEESPVFKLEAFRQDIDNLKATLKRLEIVYTLEHVPVRVGGSKLEEHISVPRFHIGQFLGRLCMILDDLQARWSAGANDLDMVPRCTVHGVGGQFMFLNDGPYCLQCLVKDMDASGFAVMEDEEDGLSQ